MRVKVGDFWYEPSRDNPIMIVLSEDDKRNIANMHPEATRYAVFVDVDSRDAEQRRVWMTEGYKPDEI